MIECAAYKLMLHIVFFFTLKIKNTIFYLPNQFMIWLELVKLLISSTYAMNLGAVAL